jgi:hypothetical protein
MPNQTLERMTTRDGIIGEANVIGAGSHTLSFSFFAISSSLPAWQ